MILLTGQNLLKLIVSISKFSSKTSPDLDRFGISKFFLSLMTLQAVQTHKMISVPDGVFLCILLLQIHPDAQALLFRTQ